MHYNSSRSHWSRDGDHVKWLEPSLRSAGEVTLGEGVVLGRERCLGAEGFFDGARF